MSSQPDRVSPPARWRKSSHSNAGNQCVEVARLADDAIAVRDSKNPHGDHLTVSAAGWRTFLSGVKYGDYREPAPF